MSYYPPGWDYDRLLDCNGIDLMALSDEHRTALFDGLKAAYGEEGFKKLFEEISRRYNERVEAARTDEEKQRDRELRAPYIQTLDLVFRRGIQEWEKWGFIIFRTTPYGPDHDDQWAEFRRRWDSIIEDEVGPHRNTLPQVDKAIDLLEFRWVEDPSLEGASPADVARRLSEMDPPRGYFTSACLMVTPGSLNSVLKSALPSSAPLKERGMIPFVVAVSTSAHLEQEPTPGEDDVAGADFKGYLKVAVEALLDEFYPITILQMMDLYNLMRGSTDENSIFCWAYRDGIHQNPEEP